MLYHFLWPLAEEYELLGVFNLFRYITFRALLAAIVSMLMTIILGHFFIGFMKNKRNVLRGLTPKAHQKKMGTPAMGGLVIFASVMLSVLFAGNLTNVYVILCCVSFFLFGAIGFVDDLKKMLSSKRRGLSTRVKFAAQFLVAGLLCLWYVSYDFSIIFYTPDATVLKKTEIIVPFFKELFFDIGVFYYFLFVVILVASSNAVNLTDGLDGLATGLALLVISSFGVFAYASGHLEIAEYLKISYLADIGELTVFVSALSASCLGFLWYNAHPAQIFMGDTGSLAIGGVIGMMAVLLKVELLLPIIAGVFVIEVVSVILQVGSFKLFKRRIFKMAPLHHHFEMMGMHESKVIARFWIAGVLFLLIALTSLKVR